MHHSPSYRPRNSMSSLVNELRCRWTRPHRPSVSPHAVLPCRTQSAPKKALPSTIPSTNSPRQGLPDRDDTSSPSTRGQNWRASLNGHGRDTASRSEEPKSVSWSLSHSMKLGSVAGESKSNRRISTITLRRSSIGVMESEIRGCETTQRRVSAGDKILGTVSPFVTGPANGSVLSAIPESFTELRVSAVE